jgi:Cu(I)/Ag(I) efflux system membrane fusion protein
MRQTYFNYKWQYIFFLSGIILSFSSCKNSNPKSGEAQTAQKEEWTCSMHPEIIRDRKGICPICGMDLVKKVQQSGVLTEVKLDELLQPTNRFVVSSIPTTTLIQKTIQPKIEALGTVSYDTRSINTISARVSGRIEKIYVHYRYQHVMKGEHIMDIYSPGIVTAEQELLFLLKNDPDNASLINAARNKLLLLGMSERQLTQIVNSGKPSMTIAVFSDYSGHLHEAGNTMPETNSADNRNGFSMTDELPVKAGMYVEKGQVIFQLFNTDKSWVLLNIFPEEQGLVKVGIPVKIIPETAPSKAFQARIDFIEPFYRGESKTLTTRVYFDNSKLEIPIGSQVKAIITAPEIKAQWLPKESVLSLGNSRLVFTKKEGGFQAHKIETGISYENWVQIRSGIDKADSVASNAQYLADSEGLIKSNN